LALGIAGFQLAVPRKVLRLLGIAPSRSASAVVRLLGGAIAVGATAACRVAQQDQTIKGAVTINRSPEEVYGFFRRFELLPSFMDYLESVQELDETRSRWTARVPTGRTLAWDARITEDVPGEVIAWRSVDGSRIAASWRITFSRAPGGTMTEVRVEMELGLRGRDSSRLAQVLASPEVHGDLRRLKQVLETGEVLVSDATAHKGKHPAQPDPRHLRRPRAYFDERGATP
jgi:uncharacterized membrane protein